MYFFKNYEGEQWVVFHKKIKCFDTYFGRLILKIIPPKYMPSNVNKKKKTSGMVVPLIRDLT